MNDEEARLDANQFGVMPLIVLTAARHPAPVKDFDAADQAIYYAAWKRAHDALALLSKNGKSIVVNDSGHFIQRDQPEELVKVIGSVVENARVQRKMH